MRAKQRCTEIRGGRSAAADRRAAFPFGSAVRRGGSPSLNCERSVHPPGYRSTLLGAFLLLLATRILASCRWD